jgi:hypothetical protein
MQAAFFWKCSVEAGHFLFRLRTALSPSLPGLTRQSMSGRNECPSQELDLTRALMDARVKPAHDTAVWIRCVEQNYG